MDPLRIARDNHAIYFVMVPLRLCESNFADVICDSLQTGGPVQCSFEGRDYSGYILVDVRANCSSGGLLDALDAGLLGQIVRKFPRRGAGGMNTDVTIVHDIWTFAFRITKYERDSEHAYEPVIDPLPLPDGEKLGRFIELRISLNG